MAQQIDKDIKFDRYGDISFIGNDLDTLSEYRDIVYQNVIDRLITNFGDYELAPNYGADLSSFKGKNVLSGIEDKIRSNIIKALIADNFLDLGQINVIAIRDVDVVMIRISINSYEQHLPIAEEFTINAIYNTSSGMLHATN